LVLGSLLLLVGITEISLQFVVPILYRPRVTRVDPVLGWYHNPSVSVAGELEGYAFRVSYNAHGYRVPEHSLTNKSGRPRVVILGDSFVEGSEVDDRDVFTYHLQQDMPGVEFINLGVYGYSTAQELCFLVWTAVLCGSSYEAEPE